MLRVHSCLRLMALGLMLSALSIGLALAGQVSESAFVRVLLPAGADKATVLFGTHVTKDQTGTNRLFTTPPLAAGKSYTYDVTAIWSVHGKEVKHTQTASVTGGQTITVDFAKTEKERPQKTNPSARTFLFTYAATLDKLPAGKPAKVWIPVPTTTADQEVMIDKEDVPGKSSVGVDPLYGNKMLYFEALPDKDGRVNFSVTYKVTRREVKMDAAALRQPGTKELIARFLQADKLVPLDGKPLDLVKDKQLDKDPIKIAKAFYDVVNTHMKYSKAGTGWGNGDAVWACDSKFGNCSDFHSLFIALARAHKIPAKFEMGFPLPVKRGEGTLAGYHCWAWFLPEGKGWIPVDISEANRHPELRDYYFGNLTADRVQFTTGRDIDLVPRQAGPPLNFFIYPYAEVDGEPLPRDQIHGKYTYRDIAP